MEKKTLDLVKEWADTYCVENDLFLVDIDVSKKNITLYVDAMENITISQCARFSRYLLELIEEKLDILNTYTLDVSSPGMTNPLKHPLQYQKRVEKSLIITLNDETKIEGILKQVKDTEIEIEETIPKNKKLKIEEHTVLHKIKFNDISKSNIPIKLKKTK